MGNPIFFDLHCHPGLKSFLTASRERDRVSCWKYINVKGIFGLYDGIFQGHLLDSNSCLSQLNKGNVSIAVVGLYAYEKAMIKGILQKIQSYRFFGKIKQLDYTHMQKISSKSSKYFKLFREVQRHLLKSKKILPKYNLINKFSDLDPNKLNVVLSIEGGHNLFNKNLNDHNNGDGVMKHFKKLKSGKKRRYFFFGPAHLERNPLCTHAYGMKIIEDDKFRPDGKRVGISALGKRIIRRSLETPNRILIDIKHMSLASRLQYYDMLKKENLGNIPILISHAGVTGVSYKSMPIVKCELEGEWAKVEYYKPKGLMRTSFNPWSINLFDEELRIIIKSKGIIGMNLDERILGTRQYKPKDLSEYFSRKEFVNYWNQVPGNNGINSGSRLPQNAGSKKFFVRHRDVKHLCNNILHIVRIAGPDAWDHICIGSDYDGLVDTIDRYNNSVELTKLRSHMIMWLPRMAESIGNNLYHINKKNVEKRVDGIMFENAFRFLKANFN